MGYNISYFSVWGVRNDSKAEYYMKFIRAVVNMSYSNLQDFKEFGGDVTLMNVDIEDLIKKVNNLMLFRRHN
jgi:hypothetical protein